MKKTLIIDDDRNILTTLEVYFEDKGFQVSTASSGVKGLQRYLAVLCPFLHYSRIDSQREMTVCGAYLDRLVLGGRWLREVCETEDHLHCEYFLNPRLKY
jgi:hypothetical protein